MKSSLNQLLFFFVLTLTGAAMSCSKEPTSSKGDAEHYIKFTANGKSYTYDRVAFAQYDLSRDPNDRLTPPYLALIAHQEGQEGRNRLMAIHLYSKDVEKKAGIYDAEISVPPLGVTSEASLAWVDEHEKNYIAGVSKFNMDAVEKELGYRPGLVVNVTHLTADRVRGTFTAVGSLADALYVGRGSPYPIKGEFNLPIVNTTPSEYEGNKPNPANSSYYFKFDIAGQGERTFAVSESEGATLVHAQPAKETNAVLGLGAYDFQVSQVETIRLMLMTKQPITTATYVHSNYAVLRDDDVHLTLSQTVTDLSSNSSTSKTSSVQPGKDNLEVTISHLTDTEIKGTFKGFLTSSTTMQGTRETGTTPIAEPIVGSFYFPIDKQ